MVHIQILSIKVDILTNTFIFPGKPFKAAISGRHCYIENSISTRSQKKNFMMLSLKLCFGKNMEIITYLGTF